MTAETTLFIFILSLYFAQCALFIYGVLKSRFDKDPSFQPRVSVVTAARNEEQNIGACIESLTRLDYPKDKLEIIIVDDGSTDATLTSSAVSQTGIQMSKH